MGHPAINVWVLTDDKPGHRNQLLGLCQRLETKIAMNVHWISVRDEGIGALDWLLKRNPFPAQGKPDWVIGAGQRTQPMVWACKRIFGARTIILMKPSYLPVNWFDACIVPKHDKPKPAANVLVTTGVLNTMEPVTEGRDQQAGLILIGGINDHYLWNASELEEQVIAICDNQPNVHWTLTNSRRTPEGFMADLGQKNLANLTLVPVEETPDGWVKQQLESVGQVWVTCDSVSMVFESITAHAPTGLLAMKAKRKSRVVGLMEDVIRNGWACGAASGQLEEILEPASQTFWEAERAAKWLIGRMNGCK